MNEGEVIAGRFELESLAGTGGMGAVFRARDRETGDWVAVKVLKTGGAAADIERFAREAQLLAELRHPGIVRYLDHGTIEPAGMYLAMEWLEGEDLSKRLAREGLTWAESLSMVERVAEALALAHKRAIIHRDIKPGNVFLVNGDLQRIKLLDFGIARLMRDAPELTSAGFAVGTPGYMSPEQARCSRDIDARADVFALGCLLFKCCAGRPPFLGRDAIAVIAKIALEQAPRLSELRSDVPEVIDDLVARLLAPRREDRPMDAAAVAAEISAIGAVDGAQLSPISKQPVAITSGERRLVCVVLARRIAPGGHWTSASAETSSGNRHVTGLYGGADDVDELPTQAGESAEHHPYGAAEKRLGNRLRNAASAHGARVVLLADGSAAVTLSAIGTATDLTSRAAHCALAIRAILPDAPIALATGRADVTARLPVGEVIDRAVVLLRTAKRASDGRRAPARSDGVALDDVTAGLLDDGFEISGDVGGIELRGLRTAGGQGHARTLLGKSTPFVGRDREMLTLEAVSAECVNDSVASAVLVTAAAGVGKSRLRFEFVRRLRERTPGAVILTGRGDSMSAGSPFGLLAQAVRGAAGLVDGEPLELRQQKLRARLSRTLRGDDLARATEFIGELVSVPFDDRDRVQLRAARQNSVLMGDQIRRALEDWLAAESAEAPVVLVLEDLHWGDLPTVRSVQSVLRNLHDRPVMLLALARPEVHAVFPNLFSEQAITEIQLTPLSRKACERLARLVLGATASNESIERVVTQSGGNAFYLEELIRAVAEGNESVLPETVIAMVQMRLEALESDARRLLRAASVFGQVFWMGGVMGLLGGGEQTLRVTEWIAELVTRELVVRRRDGKFHGEEEFAFRQAMVREAAYAMLTDADRVLGHRLSGQWLAAAGESDGATLAEHFERGGEPERAVRWYLQAVRQALEGNDLAAVIARAERGVACGASGEVLGSLRLLQAEAHRWRGENADADRRGSEAIELLPRGSRLWCGAAAEVAMATGRMGDVLRLVSLAKQLLAVQVMPEANGAHRIAAARAAIQLMHSGRNDLAGEVLALAERDLGELGENDPAVAGWIDTAKQSAELGSLGDPGAARALARSAVAHFERAGDLRAACMQRVNVGYAWTQVGHYREAEHTLREAVSAAERLGLNDALAIARQNLGLALALGGQLGEARNIEEATIATFLAQSNRMMEGGSRNYLAMVFALAGDPAASEQQARAAVEVLAASPPARAYALATLSNALRLQRRNDEALAAAHDAMTVIETLGSIEEGDAAVRLAYAEALFATGDEVDAVIALRHACDRLFERAGKIHDNETRQSFLENVPEHARTLALASEWQHDTLVH